MVHIRNRIHQIMCMPVLDDEFEFNDHDKQRLRALLPGPAPGEEAWKVVKVDNFNREGPGFDDTVVEVDLTEKIAKQMADLMNKPLSSASRDYYIARPMSAKDQTFTP